MLIFAPGTKSVEKFKLNGIPLIKEVYYEYEVVRLVIKCGYTNRTIVNAALTDEHDYYCQMYTIRLAIDNYFRDYLDEKDRLFAFISSREINHELFD